VGPVTPSAAYWTYVFPLSALGSVSVNYYTAVHKLWCEIIMWICVALSSLSFLLVFGITCALFFRWLGEERRSRG
jgi:hypothetical protein